MQTKTRPEGSGAREAERATRRDFVVGLVGGLGATALLAACETEAAGAQSDARADGDGSGPPDAAADTATPDTATPDAATPDAATPDAGAHCTVYPEQTAGPFYLDLDLVRRDVTEGKPGARLRLVIRVLAADGCTPLRDAAVEIWHCDAAGVYSGFAGQLGGLDTTGERFLRGTQISDDDGRVRFDTVYPGWYPGRTTHIHFRVRPTANTQATSQLYFPEDVSRTVYEQPPYAVRGPKDTPNASDGVVRASGLPPLAAVTSGPDGLSANLTVTVAA